MGMTCCLACDRCGPSHAVSFRDGTYRADVAGAGKVYRQYRWLDQPAAEGPDHQRRVDTPAGVAPCPLYSKSGHARLSRLAKINMTEARTRSGRQSKAATGAGRFHELNGAMPPAYAFSLAAGSIGRAAILGLRRRL